MIAEERPPALGWRVSSLGHVLGHAGLSDIDAELEEFAMDPRRSPQRIGDAHLSRRISAGTVGRPERGRDFQRQYDLNPARCHRTTVSGFTSISALRVPGSKRYSATKIRRSMALKFSRFGK